MSCETKTGLYTAAFKGVTCTGDMALWKKPPYNDSATMILLSLDGSENQVRGLFSALATNNQIEMTNGEEHFHLTRGWQGHLRFNKWRIGYGKYHALIWNEELASQCIIIHDKPEEAWERFLKKKRVPFLKEWIPHLIRLLENQGLAEILDGVNMKGWHWTASDDQVCDLLVQKIHK